jgi:putative heme-binding domain-containing protein
MKKRYVRNVALGAVLVGVLIDWPQALQQTPPQSQERAQDQPFPPGSPFALLPGFKIERVTPADQTESLIVITFDSLGRPVVSQSASGNGSSPRILLDNNNDGVFESEKIVSDKLNTCHGLFFAGRMLYANCRGVVPGDPEPTADAAPGRGAPPPAAPGGGQGRGNQPPAIGIPGLYKLEDTNGDDVMDTIERIQRYTGNGMGDHGPHAIRRGPDGSVMFLVGNNTYVGAPPVNDDVVDKDASPSWNNMRERQFLPQFNDPRFGNSARVGVHAMVWRLQPSNKYALFYSGMRNPYDFAYNLAGEAFTFDSDMEWDVNAPWYREVRTVHMIPGGDSGYRNGTGKFQDEYFDTLPALRHLRRGSPVGVEVYQSYAYPMSFFDNLFEADWSRGRLLYTALTPSGATYRGREDLAEFVHGEPMPITDLEVGPDGNIYFTTGGGGIGQGGLYKVSWAGARPAQPDMTGVLAVVRQPQPLSSWAWAAIEKVKTSMGASFGSELEKLARSASASAADRARAVLELQRHGPAPSPELLRALAADRDATVRAAAVYAAGVQTSDGARSVAAAALKDPSQLVKRRAAEALVRQGLTPGRPSFAPVADIYALLKDADRFVRYSGRLALEHTPRNEWLKLVMNETNVVPLTEGLLAAINTVQPEQAATELAPVFEKLVGLMKRPSLTADDKIRVLRTFEVAASELPNGVDAGIKKQVHDALIGQFPSRPSAVEWVPCTSRTATTGCPEMLLTHHMAKVLAYAGEPDVIGRILAVMPKGDADQPGQIDFLYALRVLETGWTKAQKQEVIDRYARASKWRGGSTFAGHVNNIFDATIDAFDPEEKKLAYEAVPLFAPLTDVEIAAVASGAGRRGGGGGGGGNVAPPGPAGAPGAPPPAAAAAAGGRGGPPVPATVRNIPLDRQERYDNLVFPRGGPAGSLAGRGGVPDPAAGAKVFRDSCAQCHRFGPTGNTYAPDLTTVGRTLLRRDILRAIFFPSETVAPQYETTVIVTRDNRTLRGLLVSESAQSVVLKTAEEPEPVTVAKAQIATQSKEKASIMPDDLVDKVGDAAIRDVTVYLLEGTVK